MTMPHSSFHLTLRAVLMTVLLLSVAHVWAAEPDTVQTSAAEPPDTKVVPFDVAAELQNRFRIDHLVDHVILIVQREYGSAPVVIVLPDGSKWYASRHPETVRWHDSITGDMIYITAPMPGPWQVLGRVMPGSKIKKISSLDIQVQAFPQPLYQGEKIKLVAQLIGDEQRLIMTGLDNFVAWQAIFAPQSKVGDANFSLGTVDVGGYKDDGHQYDERHDDGLFTSNLNLNQPWGDYELIVKARNDMFERQVSFPFRLSEYPVNIEVITPKNPLIERWKLQVTLDNTALKLDETHFELTLTGPAGVTFALTIDNVVDANFEYVLPFLKEFGTYTLQGELFSTLKTSGRELIITLPEQLFSFIKPPSVSEIDEDKTSISEAELAVIALQKAAIQAAKDTAAEEEAMQETIAWVVAINTFFLLLGAVVIIVWRKRQSLAQALAAAEQRLVDEAQETGSAAASLADIDLSKPEDPSDKKT